MRRGLITQNFQRRPSINRIASAFDAPVFPTWTASRLTTTTHFETIIHPNYCRTTSLARAAAGDKIAYHYNFATRSWYYQSDNAKRATMRRFGTTSDKWYAEVAAGNQLTLANITQEDNAGISCVFAGNTTGTGRAVISTHAASNTKSRIFGTRSGDATPVQFFLGWGGADRSLSLLPITEVNLISQAWRLNGTTGINGIASGQAEQATTLPVSLTGMTDQACHLWLSTGAGGYQFVGFMSYICLIKESISNGNRATIIAGAESLLPSIESAAIVSDTTLHLTFVAGSDYNASFGTGAYIEVKVGGVSHRTDADVVGAGTGDTIVLDFAAGTFLTGQTYTITSTVDAFKSVLEFGGLYYPGVTDLAITNPL